MLTTVTTGGQITIPGKMREKLGIKGGTKLQVEVDEAEYQIILKPITREYIHGLRGKFKGKGLMSELV